MTDQELLLKERERVKKLVEEFYDVIKRWTEESNYVDDAFYDCIEKIEKGNL